MTFGTILCGISLMLFSLATQAGAQSATAEQFISRPPSLNHLVDRKIDRYSLLLFSYKSSTLTSHDIRVLKEYVYPEIRKNSRIKVSGYADVLEADLELSRERGRNVARHLEASVDTALIRSLDLEGVGSEQPLYTNDLPEGRFYNRTVQILVEYPVSH